VELLQPQQMPESKINLTEHWLVMLLANVAHAVSLASLVAYA